MRFVQHNAAKPQNVALVNASPMVELVEAGSFLFSPTETQASVTAFVDEIFRRYPFIDILTLSSTHLPWLRLFFEAACPTCQFLDPAEKIVVAIGEGTVGAGQVRGFVTQDEKYDLETFRRMLAQIGVDIPLELVSQL